MIRTKEILAEELQKLAKNQDSIAQRIYNTMLSNGDNVAELKNSLIDLYENMPRLVDEKGPSEFYQKLINTGSAEKQSLNRAIEREAKKTIKKYNLFIADYLSIYRDDTNCMEIAKGIYSALECTDYDYYQYAQESLGVLCSDESCVIYNLGEAFINFTMSNAKDSNDPEILYRYAKTLDACNNEFKRMDALSIFKKAADLGHKKAREEYQIICRRKNLCTACGGGFKGIFIKKCSSCGKKKDYK